MHGAQHLYIQLHMDTQRAISVPNPVLLLQSWVSLSWIEATYRALLVDPQLIRVN